MAQELLRNSWDQCAVIRFFKIYKHIELGKRIVFEVRTGERNLERTSGPLAIGK